MWKTFAPWIIGALMAAHGPALAVSDGLGEHFEIEAGTTLRDLGVRRNHEGPLVLIEHRAGLGRVAHFFRRGENAAYRAVVLRSREQAPESKYLHRAGFQSPESVSTESRSTARRIKPYGGAINTTDYRHEINRIANRHGVDPALVRAVVHTESHFQPEAVSSAGAAGLMQLMPETAKRFGVTDRTDPVQNIEGGVRYLRFLIDTFDELEHVVAGYNAGEGAVMRHDGVPPYSETQQFVPLVMARYERYREVMQ